MSNPIEDLAELFFSVVFLKFIEYNCSNLLSSNIHVGLGN